jgi:hypothetical protein
VAAAAPNEIKVFTDELAGYGGHTLETHVNKTSRAGPDADNRATPLQVMPEYSYGIWRNWEISFRLPFAVQQGQLRTNGYRGELQYVAPHDEEHGLYWGFNLELVNLAQRSQVVYVAWDGKIGKSDINLGLGHGFSDASDRWVLKTILEFAF